MKPNHPPVTLEDYSSAAAINSKKLINLVRRNEVLYNSAAYGYRDKCQKMMAWEHIHSQIFPEYASLSEDIKVAIGLNVRRHWKKLRDTITAEIRKCMTVEDYMRKKGSPLISELEFLIPHIRTEHCKKLASELRLTGNLYIYSYVNNTLDGDDEVSNGQFNNLIDLTYTEDPNDIKPEIFDLSSDDSSEYPELPDLPAIPDSHVIGNLANSAETDVPASDVPQNERQRSLDETATHTKILQLLTHKEVKEDEDRMFLLSLVSAMKRVPHHKKIQVKSEIAATIAQHSE